MKLFKSISKHLLFASLLPGTTMAAGSVTSTIEQMMMDENYNAKIFVKASGALSNAISCSTHPVWDFVIDTSSTFGIQMYGILLNAYNKGTAIQMLGTGNCDVFNGIETLRRVELPPQTP